MSELKKISVEEEIQEALSDSKEKFPQETVDKLAALLKLLDEKCPPQPHLRLKLVRVSKTSVFDSKLGGVPYFPKDMEYPKVLEGEFAGKPLRLLAQLNFTTLPHLEGFPQRGILQFFAGCDGDYDYGIDYRDGFHQNGFRVIYHETILDDTAKLMSKAEMPEFDSANSHYPFKGEFLLRPEVCHLSAVTPSDYRFDPAVAECYNTLFGGDVAGMWKNQDGKMGIHQVDEPLYDAIYTVRHANGSGIGGFPFFMQEDPRPCDSEYSTCNIVLFQLDSEFSEGSHSWDDAVMWGDSGVGNFFISAENLAKCDFSRVLYTWDCC